MGAPLLLPRVTGLLACPQEPYKAFRWLMLSDVCFDTKKRCAVQYNRTHDLPYTETRPLAESDDPRMQDWLNGPIPRRHPGAVTGASPDDLLQEAPQRGKRERGKRKKGAWKNGGKGAGAEARRERAQKRRLARARRQRKGRDAIP